MSEDLVLGFISRMALNVFSYRGLRETAAALRSCCTWLIENSTLFLAMVTQSATVSVRVGIGVIEAL